jgi:hypothetical protein
MSFSSDPRCRHSEYVLSYAAKPGRCRLLLIDLTHRANADEQCERRKAIVRTTESVEFQTHLPPVDKAHRNGPRLPQTASQQRTELHQGTYGSGDGIDTEARDDTESTWHITLPLSSTVFGDYSHLTATKMKKMTTNRFCEDKDSDKFDDLELLESI